MAKFDPASHLIDLRGKKYLPVAQRLVWFREDYPGGSIQTEVMNYDPLVVRASVYNNDGALLATGHGSANIQQGAKVVWSGREIEKAETAAIGRALGHAGFGTQFDNDDDDLDNLADSPVDLINLVNKQNGTQSRQDAPKSDLQGSDQPDIATPAKSPSERLGTPPKQTIAPRAGKWAFDRNALLTQLSTWAKDHAYQERNNAVKAMDSEGAFAECADIGEATQLVLARLATHKKAQPA